MFQQTLIDFDSLDRRIAANSFMSPIKQQACGLLEETHLVPRKSENTNQSVLSNSKIPICTISFLLSSSAAFQKDILLQ